MIRIILVELDPNSAQDIKSRLQRVSYDVVATTATVDDVITRANELKPDLILMDIRMKGDRSAIDAAREIKQHHNVPIVFIAPDVDVATVRNAIAAEPDGFLINPLDERELLAAIEVAIHKHQKEQSALASERRIRELTDALPEVVYETDAHGAFTFVNAACRRMFGYTKKELLAGMTVFDVLLPDDRNRGREVFRQRMDTQRLGWVDYTALQKDGSTFLISVRAVPIKRDGTAIGVRGIIVDVTKRKRAEAALHNAHDELEQPVKERTANLARTTARLEDEVAKHKLAEQALKESEARYRRLVERSFDAVLIHSDGVIRLANEAATRILKAASSDELVGMNVLDLPAPRYRELAKERISSVYETNQSSELAELKYCALDGTTIDVEAMATPITYEGRPALYVVFRDIGERKQMEAQLKQYAERLEDLVEERTAQLAQSEEYFRTLFEASSVGQVRLDAEGHPIRINKAAAELFGIHDVSDVSRWNFFSNPRISEQTGLPLREGQAIEFEQAIDFQAIKKTGEFPTTRSDVRHVYVYVLPLFSASHDTIEGYLSQLVDITERKLVEDALQDAQRLAGIGETTTMIGHDLRNPLQALQYSLELELMYFDAMPPEVKADPRATKAAKLVTAMQQQITYMDKIVSDLQDYARPLRIEREHTNIARLIENTLSALTIPESIAVHLDIPSPLTATIDPHLMQRALTNLTTNAVQAMPEGGELMIRAAAADSTLVITVQDTGKGVPQTMKDTLFSPLTTGKAKGTGLGLAVVKRIVAAHGGTIGFESEEGNGTTFTMTLPQTAD